MGFRRDRVFAGVSLLILAWAATSSQAAPSSVAVHLTVHGRPAAREVLVRAQGGDTSVEAVVALDGEAGERAGAVDLELPAPGVWSVEATAPDCWSPARTLVVPEERTVTLHLWQTGKVEFRATLEEGGEVPRPTVTLWSPPASPTGQPELEGEPFPCTHTAKAQGAGFRCAVPGGRWDVRLRVPGHVSRYFWDLDVNPGKPHELGVVTFRRGASVVGWVAAEAGNPDLSRTVLTLAPFTQGPEDAGAAARTRRRSPTTQANGRGFFHFEDVTPGRYVLRARAPGSAVAEAGPFDVFPGAETALRDEVLLQEPARLTVVVDPPSDPWDRRWRVELHRMKSETWARMERVAGGETDAGGTWSHGGLAPGDYRIVVTDVEGSGWWDEANELRAGDQQLHIEMPLLPICGRVRVAKEPVIARLRFQEVRKTPEGVPEGSMVGVPMESDGQGNFQGWLPHPGTWAVTVDAAAWGIQRTAGPFRVETPSAEPCADLEIRLPDTAIAGHVVDADGAPVAGARVTAIPHAAGGEVPISLLNADSAGDGSFSLQSVDPGEYTLSAKEGGRRSRAVTVVVVKDRSSEEVTLVLEEPGRVRGTVASAFGPVSGAMVMMLVPGHAAAVGPVLTEADGSFELEVPAGAGGGTLVVAASGFCLHLARVTPPAPESLSVVVDQACGDLVVRGAGDPAGRDVVLFSAAGASVAAAFFPGWNSMNGLPMMQDGGLLLARLRPGPYLVCSGIPPTAASPGGRCEGATVVAGSASEVDLHGE